MIDGFPAFRCGTWGPIRVEMGAVKGATSRRQARPSIARVLNVNGNELSAKLLFQYLSPGSLTGGGAFTKKRPP